ncbi:unnamed protein product, partial [Tetraodon nigroviridis]
LNSNNINGNSSGGCDANKNPIILSSDGRDFPVHECVFKGDVRRLSSLIRTHSITQKDAHGDFPLLHRVFIENVCPEAHLRHLSSREHPPAPGSDAGPQRMCAAAPGPQCPREDKELAGMEPAGRSHQLRRQADDHCHLAQVEAAVQGERGGQEAQVTESSPRARRLLSGAALGLSELGLKWQAFLCVPQCLCCPGSFRLTPVRSTNRELTSGRSSDSNSAGAAGRRYPGHRLRFRSQNQDTPDFPHTPVPLSPFRLDTTLIDFTDMKCQRGDLSFIFNGDAPPSQSFVVLDNEAKVYQRIHHEESEMETEEEVDILMSSDVYSATLSTKSITFSRSQIGWLFREDKTERVGNFLADFYSVNGLVLESRKRREHLSEEDILRNKAIMESLSKGGSISEHNFEPVRRQSLTAPAPNTISWEEYITAEAGKPPHLGRELVCKESKKYFKATVAMSQDFPLGIESLLNVLEVVAPFKHFNKLREFVQMKLPPGFPVKLDIPVFPTITATVTFQEFHYDEFEESIFFIPEKYKEDPSRFPDL